MAFRITFGRIFRSSTAVLLAATVTLLGSEGCVTFSVEETGPAKGSPPRAASLRLSVYQDRVAMKKGDVFGGSVRSKLLRLEPEPEETVFESAEASWSVAELPPGKYRLEVTQRAGPDPASPEVWNGRESFKVKAGEDVSALLIVHDTRVWAWAGLGVGIGGFIVVGLLILVGIFSLGTRGITLSSRDVGSPAAASRSADRRLVTPRQPSAP